MSKNLVVITSAYEASQTPGLKKITPPPGSHRGSVDGPIRDFPDIGQ